MCFMYLSLSVYLCLCVCVCVRIHGWMWEHNHQELVLSFLPCGSRDKGNSIYSLDYLICPMFPTVYKITLLWNDPLLLVSRREKRTFVETDCFSSNVFWFQFPLHQLFPDSPTSSPTQIYFLSHWNMDRLLKRW